MQFRHLGAVGLLLLPTVALATEPAPVSVDTLQIITAVEEDVPVTEVVVDSLAGAEPDSLFYASEDDPLEMEMITVSARRVTRVAGADRVELDRELVESRGGGSVADLATLLPSTKLTVNSRGESLFMVRGSSERHVRVMLDGIRFVDLKRLHTVLKRLCVVRSLVVDHAQEVGYPRRDLTGPTTRGDLLRLNGQPECVLRVAAQLRKAR